MLESIIWKSEKICVLLCFLLSTLDVGSAGGRGGWVYCSLGRGTATSGPHRLEPCHEVPCSVHIRGAILPSLHLDSFVRGSSCGVLLEGASFDTDVLSTTARGRGEQFRTRSLLWHGYGC